MEEMKWEDKFHRLKQQFDGLRVKLRGPHHMLNVSIEIVDLSAAAKGRVFTDAELKKLFRKHKMSHGRKPHVYTLLTRTLEKRLIKPADVAATLEARFGEATQMAPAATVVLLDIESPPGTEDGKQELSAVPRMPTYTKYKLWRMLLLDGHDASPVWGCRKLLLEAFRKRLISEDEFLFNLLGRMPPATSGGGEVRATTEPQSSPLSPEGMFHTNAQLRELLAQVGERCGPNADEDLMLLRALECDLVMWEDLMVEPPPQVPKVRPPAEGEPFTTASLRQLLRDHDIPFHPNMSCKRLANLAKLKGIATGSQLKNRKPEPERRRDPTHLEKLMEEVAQQLKVQCMREACEPGGGREEPQQRRGRGRGNARPYCRGTYFTDQQLYRMLREVGEAQGVHPNDPRPVLLQSCLEAHLVTLWDVVAEMSPQQRKAKTEVVREAPIPDGVYYTKDELRRALKAAKVKVEEGMRRPDLVALALGQHLITKADAAARPSSWRFGPPLPPPNVVLRPPPTAANGRVLAVMKSHKLALETLLCSGDTLTIIEDAVQRMNVLRGHAMRLAHYYAVHCLEAGRELPPLTRDFYVAALYAVSREGLPHNPSGLQRGVKEFFDAEYKRTMGEGGEPELVSREGRVEPILFEGAQLAVNVENNIREHSVEHLCRLVNVHFQVPELVKQVWSNPHLSQKQKQQRVAATRAEFRDVKNDVLQVPSGSELKFTCPKKYHAFVRELREAILPKEHVFAEQGVAYDVKRCPHMYARGFLELCRRLERAGSRLPAALPLRGSQVPGNITIDTRALVHLVSLASDEPLLEAMARVWSAPVCDMVAAVPTGQGEQPVAAGSADPAADDGDDEGELVDDDDADATETTMETEAEQPEAPTTGATPPNSPRDRLVQAISALVQQRLSALQAGGDDTAMAVETTARPARPTRAHGNAEYFADRMVDWLVRRLQERPGALPEGVTATRLRDALAAPLRHLMVGALQDTLRQLRRQAYDGPFTREIKDIVWWSRGFNLDHRDFRAGPAADPRYLFRHMIRTNRVAVSVSLVRCDMQEATRMQLRRRGPKPVPPCCKYLADCSEEELERFRRMRLVVIDPGMGKLLHVFDGVVQMQYSRSQLRVESRHYKFERKLGQLAQTALKHGGRTQTVEQWNTELSEQCARAMTTDGQREWLGVANPLDHAMCEHPCNEEYRRLRHQHRCNEQRSYDWMLNRFEKLYGKPGEVLVLFGDWDMRNHHLRGSPPTKGKGMRELFEKRGYDVRLINEAYTSKRCSVCCCAGETKTLMQRPDKRRGKEGEMRTVWRLVQCQNTECEWIHNRDTNAAFNLLRVALAVLHGLPRPAYLCHPRSQNTSSTSSSRSQPESADRQNRRENRGRRNGTSAARKRRRVAAPRTSSSSSAAERDRPVTTRTRTRRQSAAIVTKLG